MRWAIKGLGFVGSAFLARLLMPEDFGLVAIVMVAFGFISLLFEFGVNWALIQNNNATDEHYHTAWTIRIIQSVIITILLIIFAPFIANFYNDTRVEEICYILAFSTFILGLENIGTIKFQKELEFSKDFYFNVLPKIISTAMTIGLAFYYKSYMALVVGIVLSSVIRVIASYLVQAFRPKFSLKEREDIWGFSQWILIRNIAQYINTQGDLIILSLMASPAKIGYYRWGTELSFMAITEIQQPFSRALTPSLASIKEDPPRLINAYLKALSAMTLVVVPFALGFGAVSQELIPLFLGGGDKWLPVVPIIEALVFFAMLTSMYGISGSLLTITGNVKYTAYFFWIQAAFTIISLYPAYYFFDLVGVAYARVFIGIAMFLVVSKLVIMKCNVTAEQILGAVWRSVTAGLIMYFTLLYVTPLLPVSLVLLMISKILIGALIYVLFISLFWVLSGMPNTMENTIIQKILTLPLINRFR